MAHIPKSNPVFNARMNSLLKFLQKQAGSSRGEGPEYLEYYADKKFRPHGWTFSQFEKAINTFAEAGLLVLVPEHRGVAIYITQKGMDTDHVE